MIDKVRMGRYP